MLILCSSINLKYNNYTLLLDVKNNSLTPPVPKYTKHFQVRQSTIKCSQKKNNYSKELSVNELLKCPETGARRMSQRID